MARTEKSGDTAEINALSLIGDGESFKEELCQMLESAQIFSGFSRGEIQTLAGYARAQAAVLLRVGNHVQHQGRLARRLGTEDFHDPSARDSAHAQRQVQRQGACGDHFDLLERAKDMAGYARAYAVEKGATIFKEGSRGSFMCIVIDGCVDIFKESDAHQNKRITTIRPGKTMGEMSILDELPYSATAIATADTTP